MILAPVKLAYPLHLFWLATENEVLVYKSSICIFTFLKVLFSEQSYRFISETFSIEFSGLHYCLFVKVLTVVHVWHNSDSLSCIIVFCQALFYIYIIQIFIIWITLNGEIYHIISFSKSQSHFMIFLNLFYDSKRTRLHNLHKSDNIIGMIQQAK